MEAISTGQLVALLRSRRLRVRTGLWLLKQELLGHEPAEAARLGIAHADLREIALANVPEGSRFARLDSMRVIQFLDDICMGNYDADCVLIYNLDLLLARLKRQERQEVWQDLYVNFPHRPRALLMTMPQDAEALLPPREALTAWRTDGRLAQDQPI
jgi:hypothetical protein